MSGDLAMDSGALIFATLADVYLSSGMTDEAISILKDGLSRNPTYSLAKVILGRAYYINGDIEESLKTLEGNYEELKDSENTNLYIGHCYKKLGELEKAAEYYDITLKINPENTDAKQELEVLVPESKQVVIDKDEEIAAFPAKDEEEIIEETAAASAKDESVIGVALPLGTQEVIETASEPMVEESEKIEVEPKRAAEEPVETTPEPTTEEQPKIETQPVIEEFEKVEIEPKRVAEEPVETIPEPAIEEPEKVEVEPKRAAEEETEKTPAFAEVEQEVEQPIVLEEKKEEQKAVTTPEPEKAFPLQALEKPMKRLLNMEAVKGAFICSKDGLLIHNYYEECGDIELISAMVAAIHNEAEESFKFLKDGSVDKFIIDKIEYPICVITAGESLLTVVTQPEAKPGLVFVYARKIIEEISEILG